MASLQSTTNDLNQKLASLSASAQSDQPTSAPSEFKQGQYFAGEAWADVGSSSHSAAVQTFLWAARSGGIQRLAEAMNLNPEQRARMVSSATVDFASKMPFAGAKGVKILDVNSDSEEQVRYICEFDWSDEKPRRRVHFSAQRSGDELKCPVVAGFNCPI